MHPSSPTSKTSLITLSAPVPVPKDHCSSLAARLRCQTIKVPDLLLIYEPWSIHQHPATDASREDLQQIYLSTSSDREKATRVDAAYRTGVFFTATPTKK